MKQHYCVYALGTGEIIRTGWVAAPQPDLAERLVAVQASERGTGVVSGQGDPALQYVSDEAIVDRPEMALTADRCEIAANGVATATITGIPAGAIVSVRGRTVQVMDGVLEVTADRPGRYEVVVHCWPYRRSVITIEAMQ